MPVSQVNFSTPNNLFNLTLDQSVLFKLKLDGAFQSQYQLVKTSVVSLYVRPSVIKTLSS